MFEYVYIKYKWLQTLYSIDDYYLIHSDFDSPVNVYQTNLKSNEAIVSLTNDQEILVMVLDSYLMFEPYVAVSDSHYHCGLVVLDIDKMMALMIQLLIDFVEYDKMIEFDYVLEIVRVVENEYCLVMVMLLSMWHLLNFIILFFRHLICI